MGGDESVTRKRELFDLYVQSRFDIPDDLLRVIRRDMPRTFPKVKWVSEHSKEIETFGDVRCSA